MALLLAGFPVSLPCTTINCSAARGRTRRPAPSESMKYRFRSPEAESMSTRLRAPQDRDGFLAVRRDLRHNARLALGQPGDEQAVLCRFRRLRDGRERRQGLPDLARRPGGIRVALASEAGTSGRKRPDCPRDRTRHDPKCKREPIIVEKASPSRNHDGSARALAGHSARAAR